MRVRERGEWLPRVRVSLLRPDGADSALAGRSPRSVGSHAGPRTTVPLRRVPWAAMVATVVVVVVVEVVAVVVVVVTAAVFVVMDVTALMVTRRMWPT